MAINKVDYDVLTTGGYNTIRTEFSSNFKCQT